MAEMSTQQKAKEAVTATKRSLSDRFKIASAKTSGTNTKDIDVALVKATSSRFHVVPKEKHVTTLKYACSSSRSTAAYVAAGLLKRLHTATDWLTALKTLITIHRITRETDAAAFMEELLRAGGGGARGRGARVLAVDNFLDTSASEGRFDFSEWVRAYGKYLDESLEAFSAVAWHVDLEAAGAPSRLRSVAPKDLLHQLPYLQRLQRRLVDCCPRGAAARDPVTLLALGLVVRESFRLYKALSEGIINLADCFFTLDRLDALKGVELYREALGSGEALAGYYAALQGLHALKSLEELPVLSQAPADFLDEMEAYAKTAPRPDSAGGGGADAGEEGQSGQPAKRAGPLRKGRGAQAMGRFGAGVDATAGAMAARDPGMLLPAGAATLAVSAPSSPRTEESAEPVVPEEAVEEEVAPEPTPVIDLLGFEEDTGGAVSAIEEQYIASTESPKPSAMDLLGELDFGALSFGGPSAAPAAPPPSAAHAAAPPAIPDAFVVRAAADVYGKPPPQMSNPFAQPQPSPAAAVPGAAAPWAAQPQSQTQGYSPYGGGGMGYGAPAQQAQHSPYYGGGMAPSPAAAGVPFGGHQWGAVPAPQMMASTSPSGSYGQPKDPNLIRQAGAHDPFGGLTGLPAAGTSPQAGGHSPQGGTSFNAGAMGW